MLSSITPLNIESIDKLLEFIQVIITIASLFLINVTN
jgi:hypothetical protein